MNLYWGDLHCHCGISYGFGSIENALKIANRHLDFCCITGHAMWPDMYERNAETGFLIDYHNAGFEKLRNNWNYVREIVNANNTDNLVTFQSYEMHSSTYGDHHFISPDSNFPLIERENPWQLVNDSGCRAIAVPHHIGYVPGYRGINWDTYNHDYSPVVEVYSKHGCSMRDDMVFQYYHDMGPLDPRCTVEEGLRRGNRFSFTGSTDHHAGFPGSYGDGLTGIWAESKTREGLWNALLAGHTYAVTGDRIDCSFSLNDGIMGDTVYAYNREISLKATGDAPIEFVTIRKNGRVIAASAPEPRNDFNRENRYVLRIEMGWGNSLKLFHWEGHLALQDGKILRVQPYWRGRNALSPSDSDADNKDATNALNNYWNNNEKEADFFCDTVCNRSTLHPQTSSYVFEVEARPNSSVLIEINGIKKIFTIKELTEHGYAVHIKPWHSEAFKVHTAVPKSVCIAKLTLSDAKELECDRYQAEVVQTNGCRAFVSPIYVF